MFHRKHPHLAHPQYRPDIDGLRAIAILAVVIFHAFPNVLPGGFVGVDIFFVISGFLISTITFSSLEKNRFSIVEFYERRIRRIFPALLLVLAVNLIAGWYFLFADEYKQLALHTAAGAGFIQNFVLSHESGYFDTTAESKPLLHLWSLAVEEQFYLFWPLLLVFVWKRRWNFLKVTLCIALISFACNVYLTSRNPVASYYQSFPRFWELMAGGVLAYLALHSPYTFGKYKQFQSALGLIFILIALFLLNEKREFPGWWVLLPVIGAFLIISAGPTALVNQRLLATKGMVAVGLISYPLYLWHWVLLAYLNIYQGTSSITEKMGVIGTAFFLAWGTYRLIEKPMRFGRGLRTKSIVLFLGMLGVLCVGLFLYLSNYANFVRQNGHQDAYLSYFEDKTPEWRYTLREHRLEHYRSDCDFYDLEKYRRGEATKIPRARIDSSCYTKQLDKQHFLMLWGDSHAQQFYYGLNKNLPESWQILLGVSSGCVPDPNITGPSETDYCEQNNWRALQTISETHPDVVLVAQVDGHSIERMGEITNKLQMLGVRKIIFVGPVPQWKPHLNKIIAHQLWENTPQRTWVGIDTSIVKTNKNVLKAFKSSQSVKYVDVLDFFCDEEGCLTYLERGKKFGITTFDYGHLTAIASNKVAKELLVKEVTTLP